MSDAATQLRWPEEHRPEVSAFLAVNELRMDADREAVWAWLRRPDLWPSYYSNSRFVKHLGGPWPEIQLGSRWRWFTFGAFVTSEIVELEPPERLAWSAKTLAGRGHHGWLLSADGGGTLVHTEETQKGAGMRIIQPALRPMMVRQHQRWLEGLARVAAEGPPAP